MSLKKNTIVFLLVICSIIISSCKTQYPDLEDGIYAEFVTTKGIMLAKLEEEKTPITVANFVSLAEGSNTMVSEEYRGKHYYNGTIFHRVIDGFMIQAGDPTGTGKGNPGYRFKDEFNPELKHNKPGILSMANAGPKTNGSQFFITEKPKPHLDQRHTVFGELILGLDIQDSISNVETNEKDRPKNDVVIKELNIIRKGKEAKKFDANEIFVSHFAEEERLEKERAAKKEAILKATKEKFEAQKAKAITLESGLQYLITKEGTEIKLPTEATVLTHYALYFEDGSLLETSDAEIAESLDALDEKRKAAGRYQPISARIGPNAGMIPGFKEGLQQLKVGDKATLFIPYHLAYGESGTRGIPAKTNLIFEVEIIELLN
ncbi:peptidylprolyl isomerase [Cognatitamlana onchidii]|uniref:peptidylprolyl isomerase n=1 Tax=Cognatitamlana onchidii TaxID=2562860 RepID=UPI0010A67602|nr:peptidylprolyl isomerase [Algibacter onchidii]